MSKEHFDILHIHSYARGWWCKEKKLCLPEAGTAEGGDYGKLCGRVPLSAWMCLSSSHLIDHVLLLPPLGAEPGSPGRKWAGRAVTLAAGPERALLPSSLLTNKRALVPDGDVGGF